MSKNIFRIGVKKENLKDAKSHFKFKFVLPKGRKVSELKVWLHENRFRSWKQKGLNGDYYTTNYRTLHFREKDRLVELMLGFL